MHYGLIIQWCNVVNGIDTTERNGEISFHCCGSAHVEWRERENQMDRERETKNDSK